MTFLVSLRSEILKTKRTSSFYLTILAAAFGPFMSMLELLIEGVDKDHRATILNDMFSQRFEVTGLAIFPIFIILVCTMLPQIEYKNNTWKQVLASPQKKGNIFLAKFLNIQLLLVIFLLMNQLLMFVGAVIIHFVYPSVHVLNQSVDIPALLMMLANNYIALLAVCAIQFWLGLRFKSFIAPIAIGIACWFTGTVLVMQSQMSIAGFYPYSFQAYHSSDEFQRQVNSVAWTSLLYASIALVLGFFYFRSKRTSA